MVYMGGKARIAKAIASIILANSTDRQTYWEPFVGGAAVLEQISGEFAAAVASDIHPDLILMWNAVKEGWLPPAEVSERLWRELKTADPSALRGAVGFGCSFGGRWFEGYARGNVDYAGTLRRVLAKAAPSMKSVTFVCTSYADYLPTPGTVIYCDPPYEGTKPYSGTSPFDHATFWDVAQGWAESGCSVFVSEYNAPQGWECVWQRDNKVKLNASTNCLVATERLFKVRTL